MQKKIFFIILASLSFALLSCNKKDEQAGLEIQPDQNRLKISYIQLENFTSFSAKSEAVKTNLANSFVLLGALNDNIFGKTSAFFVSQYRLSSDNVSFGINPQINSIQAFLDISEHEGDSTQSLHYQIYESNFNIEASTDTSYLSDTDLDSYKGDLIGDSEQTLDSTSVLKIPLENSFGQKILDTDSNNLIDNDKFLEVYKGLYFTVDTNQTSTNLIWKFNFNSAKSYIEIAYNHTDTTGGLNTIITDTFKLQFNDKCGRFNQYFNNTTPLEPVFNQNMNKAYVAGTAGPQGHISLSPILTWRDSSKIMIYKAELIISAKEASPDISIPTKLLLKIDDNSDESLRFVDDYLVSSADNYDGTYDEETKSYHMILTRHIQNLINKNQNDSLLWIAPSGNLTNPYRVILLNGEDEKKITLKMTYSKLY